MKKHFKMLIVTLLTLLTLGSCFISMTPAGDNAQIAARQAAGTSGETVMVDVPVKNNPDVVMMKRYLAYDATALERIGVTHVGVNTTVVQTQTAAKHPYMMSRASASAMNHTADVVLATLQFKIKDTVTVGAASAITVSYKQKDIVNADLQKVRFVIANSSVEVKDYMSGDACGDGEVSMPDALLLLCNLIESDSSNLREEQKNV